MNTINLLPLAERQPKWPINQFLIISIFLLLLLFSSLYCYNTYKIWSIEKELQATRNQYELLQPTRIQMINLDAKQQLYDKKNNLVVSLTKGRSTWYSIIQHLVTITPQDLWFTDLSNTDKGVVYIKGSAGAYPAVAQLMKNLENDPIFTEPNLNKVESDGTLSIVKFEIMVKFKGMQ
ncbi:PilN domain-containing protein [Pelosinus sp. UFO1]|uniref:PilN domain-containing protein n=1 Tax=Pelosinus sp. UFO1 TaxID=484770 RepID=UPI0004D1D76C|nr:PilN domain-containing protein [Pelosinus sp. UFO1]AIF51784.1 Fimbrial assembly family protein [Pelosinus sp. UFO1]